MFEFVCGLVEEHRNWGTGCECHSAELQSGQKVDCKFKGRNLHLIAEKTRDLLSTLAEWIEPLVVDDRLIQDDLELFSIVKLVVGRFLAEATEKSTWMFEVPYLFARVLDPDVARVIVQQWNGCHRDNHHDTTIRIMDTWSPDIERIAQEDLSRIPELLKSGRDNL